MPSIIDVLPFEVISTIIDIIASQDIRPNTQNSKRKFKSLRTCSLTCQALLPLCRAYIFHSIEFHDSSNLKGHSVTPRFISLITGTPEVANYVRELRYGMQSDAEFPLLPPALDRITKVKKLALYAKGITEDWRRMDYAKRSSLLRVMHLPTVVSLDLRNIAEFTLSDLIPCTNLSHLYLEYFHLMKGDAISPEAELNPPIKSIQLQKLDLGYSTLRTVLAMLEQKWTDGRPVLGLGELKEVDLEIQRAEEVALSVKALSYAHRLEYIGFTVIKDGVNAVSAVSLISPFLTTLKTLSLVLYNNPRDSPADPYRGMCRAFQKIAGQNNIEVIKLRMLLFSYTYTVGDEWRDLENVLTAPGWPSLRQVDLHIVAYRSGDIAEAMKTLSNTQLTGLASSRFFEFNFHVSRA